MPNVAICPAREPGAIANIARSVTPGLDRSALSSVSGLAGWAAYTGANVPTWGVPEDSRGRNQKRWGRLTAGDSLLLYNEPETFGVIGTVWATERSASVSSLAWTSADYPLIVYLEDVATIALDMPRLRRELGYNAGYILGREFLVLDVSATTDGVTRFGTLRAYLEAIESGAYASPLGGSAPLLGPTSSRVYRRATHRSGIPAAAMHLRDPSELDRKTRLHMDVQNEIEAVIETAGNPTWSPLRGEPEYDLAWAYGGAEYVGEVKTISPSNHVLQLRLATGQVLRYAWELAAVARPANPVIITSDPVPDPSWERFLAGFGIRLVTRSAPSSFGTSGAPLW